MTLKTEYRKKGAIFCEGSVVFETTKTTNETKQDGPVRPR